MCFKYKNTHVIVNLLRRTSLVKITYGIAGVSVEYVYRRLREIAGAVVKIKLLGIELNR